MALVLAEHLAASGRYDPTMVLAGYTHWWADGKGVDAWDTGPTTRQILQEHQWHPKNQTRTSSTRSLRQAAPLARSSESSEFVTTSRRGTHWSPPAGTLSQAPEVLTRGLASRDDTRGDSKEQPLRLPLSSHLSPVLPARHTRGNARSLAVCLCRLPGSSTRSRHCAPLPETITCENSSCSVETPVTRFATSLSLLLFCLVV